MLLHKKVIMDKKHPLKKLLHQLQNPVDFMTYPQVKSAYDMLVDNIEKGIAVPDNPLDGIDKAFKVIRKKSIKKSDWFHELNTEIISLCRKTRKGPHKIQAAVKPDARQPEKTNSNIRILEEICEIIGCSKQTGSTSKEPAKINEIASSIKSKIIDIESDCLDISKQIQSLQIALEVQKEDVRGGIKCIPLWKPTLNDIDSAVKKTELPTRKHQHQDNDDKINVVPKQELDELQQKYNNLEKELNDEKEEIRSIKQNRDKNYVTRLDFEELEEKYDRLRREFSDVKRENQRYLQTEQEKKTKTNAKNENKGTQQRKPDESIIMLQTRIKELEVDLEEAKTEKTRLKDQMWKKNEECKKLEDTAQYWKNRVSRLAGIKLTDNNPDITDLSDPNRPTRLGEMFSEIYDNVWTDTLEKLHVSSRKKEEKEAVIHMAKLLDACYVYCEDKLMKTMEEMERVLLLNTKTHEAEKLDSEERKQLKDMLKSTGVRTSKYLDSGEVIKRVNDSKLRKDFTTYQSVTKDFTRQCLEVCWLMVVQDPQVVLHWGNQKEGSPIDADRFKSFTRSGNYLEYVVWPAMLLHTGGPLLKKGIAQPQQSSQNTKL